MLVILMQQSSFKNTNSLLISGGNAFSPLNQIMLDDTLLTSTNARAYLIDYNIVDNKVEHFLPVVSTANFSQLGVSQPLVTSETVIIVVSGTGPFSLEGESFSAAGPTLSNNRIISFSRPV